MTLIEHKRTGFDEAEKFLSDLTLQMCGGDNLDLYLGELVAQGQSQCSNIWSKGIIAYRCRTCQINDSSAICVNCFQGGNHWEHDYVMYHSESGGCCDCGDRAAWKDSGFCTIHQRLHVGDAVVKPELQGITHRVVRYVLEELLAWVVRSSGDVNSTECRDMAVIYLHWLQKVCAVDALRNLVCKDVVEIHILHGNGNSTSLLDILLEYLPRMPELIIESETTLFLQLLYQNNFKDDFLLSLKGKYENMIISAVHDREYMENYKHLDMNLDRVCEHKSLIRWNGGFLRKPAVVNVEHDAIKGKVYLRPQGDLRLIIAHGNIAVDMLIQQSHLFPKFLDVLVKLQWMNPYNLIDAIEFENSWTLAIQLEMNSMAIIYQVVSSCYQDPQFGKETLLKAATYTLKALKLYLKEVASCETIDNIGKAVSLHIPLHRTLSAILQKLVLLSWDGVQGGFISVLDFDYTKDEVLQLMEHPLRILVWMAQIRAQVWRRTSEEFSRLELIYRGSFWHDQSMDMDILLLQFCSVAHENLQEHAFIRIAEEFDVLLNFPADCVVSGERCILLKNMVTAPLVVHRTRRQSEIVLLQDFMRLILLIVRERRHLGQIDGDNAQDKCLQYDVIQWLCVRDQTYSQICRALSAISMDHQKLNAMLEKVALYHEPKVADRGYYELKPEYWKEFDPLFPHYYVNELEEAEIHSDMVRTESKRLQNRKKRGRVGNVNSRGPDSVQDRAVKVGKLEHYWRIKAPVLACAPYNRLSDVLHTKRIWDQACHLFLMNALKEVMHLVKLGTSATIGESLGVTALQMMSVLLSDAQRQSRHASSKPMLSRELQDAFSTEDIFVNIHVKLQMQAEPPLSIYQMLLQLQKAKNCSRLVDSVDHVLKLLSNSTDTKSIALEVSSTTGEALQCRLRKEQRQKAILEEFAAKQKAFWDEQDVHGVDDKCTVDNPHMKLSNTLEAAYGSTGVSRASSGALTMDPVSITGVHCVSEDASDEARECVLCRSKSDTENSSTCWIAFVQQYNLPSLVLGRKEDLEFSDNNFFSSSEVLGIPSELGPKQLITVICPPEGEESTGSCIDYVTAEHVQCCGHQIHFYCFQEHINTLRNSHDSGYAGKGLLDLNRVEFLCPICRRLANVVLPVVDASILSKKHLSQENVKGGDKIREELNKFWQSNNNLEKAVDFFSTQMLKVRGHFQNHDVPTSSFINCKALWEGLALNIVHCEVETRERYGKVKSATSSSAPINFLDEDTWGGDSAHWIALRELGKLAMLSNTLPGTAQEKGRMLGMLRQSLGLLDRREGFQMSDTSALDDLIELEKILQEMFPSHPLNTDQHTVSLAAAEVLLERPHYEDENNVQKTVLNCLPYEEPMKELEIGEDIVLCDALSCVPLAKRKQRYVGDFKADKLQLNVAVSCIQQKQKQENATTCLLNPVTSIKLSSTKTAVISENQETFNWPLDILRNGVLAADPFGLLIVFFIIFEGQPQKKAMLLMVKFAYTVAVLQTQKAVAKYRFRDSAGEKDVVQRACLPFLRRAALLVQLTTQWCEGHSRLGAVKNGATTNWHQVCAIDLRTKVMDSVYLQQALQLPDCTEIMHPQTYGVRVTLATALQCLQSPICAGSTPVLYTVPQKVLLHKLPRVFQELLLENLHKKRACVSCNGMPPDPAICLLCGVLLCCGSDCCKVKGVGECSQHAAEESAGIGIFLLLRSTQLLLLRNNRSCMGLSLYLDTHGEEDLYLRRSQLLYLSDLRMNEVRRLWLTAAFDYDSYVLHNSQSRPLFY